MTIVLQISKPGYDVKSTSYTNLSYDSKRTAYSMHSVIQAVKNNGVSIVTINHNLGYSPKVFAYYEGTDANGTYLRRIPIIKYGSSTSIDMSVTDTQVKIRFESSSGSLNLVIAIFTDEV